MTDEDIARSAALVADLTSRFETGTPRDEIQKHLDGIPIDNSYDEEERTVLTIVRNTGESPPVIEDTQIIFHIGTNNTLERVETKKLYTGP